MAQRSTTPRVVRAILSTVSLNPAALTAESLVGLQGSLIGHRRRPSRYGGSEMPADEFVSDVCELAALDGSLGWLAAMFNAGACEVAALSDGVVDVVWGADPDAVVTTAHQGSASIGAHGRLTGRLESVVGAEYADWLVLPADKATRRILVPRDAAHIAPTDEPSDLGAAGIGDVTVAGHLVDDGYAFTGDNRAAAIALAGAAAAVTGSADGVWHRHVEQMRARLATSYSADELVNAAPAQVGRAASDIDATKLQITEALRRPDADARDSRVYEQAVARARAAADRLLGNSRHALDLNDAATRLWRDVHAGCRLAATIFHEETATQTGSR